MKQHYPLDPVTGIENPALAWANGNPSTGSNGSYPPFGLFVDPQAEILAAQRASGFADSADGSDTAQLSQAISRGTWLGTLGQPATVNALTGAIPGPVIWPGLRIGMEFTGVINAPSTGPVTVALSGFAAAPGPLNLLTRNGSPLASGDIPAGVPFRFRFDGTSFRISGSVNSELQSIIQGVARPKLAANIIFYVDPVNGSDSNLGLTSALAFKTRQKAWNTVVNTLDLAGNNVLIKLLPGTYTDAFLASCPVIGNSNGTGAVTFQGSVGTNSAALISTTSGNAWLAQGGASFALDSMTIQAAGTNASGIVASVGAIIAYSNIVFNQCTLNQVSATAGGFAQQTGPVTITGGAVNHISASDAGSKINIAGQSITFQNTPAFTQFAALQGPSQITANGLVLTGGATGKQYNILGPGYLFLAGQTLPGNAAGTVSSTQVG